MAGYNRSMRRITTIPRGGRSGQAMLIAVLALGGAILGATTVAGLLKLYQIRATTDTANSAKAIFAADTGTEWALFNFYEGASYCAANQGCVDGELPAPTFAEPGLSMTVSCYANYGATGTSTLCSNTSTRVAISSGIANGSERAFFISISGSTTTHP